MQLVRVWAPQVHALFLRVGARRRGREVFEQREQAAPAVRTSARSAGHGCMVGTRLSRVASCAALPNEFQQNDHAREVVKVAGFALALILGGVFMAVGRTAVDYSWLAWIALLPLFFSIQAFRPTVACLCGLVWGVSFFACSSVALESDVPYTWGSLALLGAVPAIYAFGAAMVTRRLGFNPFVVAFGWIGVEAAVAPLGLRQGLLSALQTDAALLGVVGNLFGYILVAFVVAFVSAVLMTLLQRIRVSITKPGFIVRAIQRQIVLLPQTHTHAADFPRSSMMPRAPPRSLLC